MSAHPTAHPAPTHAAPLSLTAQLRLSGACYVLIIMLGMLTLGAITRQLSPQGDPLETLASVREAETWLRWALLGELTMFSLVLVLAMTLRGVLARVDETLARIGGAFRSAEAVLGAMVALLCTGYPLWALHGAVGVGELELAQRVQALAELSRVGTDVVLLFMGWGGVAFFVAFWRARWPPRWLAGWGLVTYAVMLALSAVSLVWPGLSEEMKLLFYAPGGIFELLFGVWLLGWGPRAIARRDARAEGHALRRETPHLMT